jgi:hypothetical protein
MYANIHFLYDKLEKLSWFSRACSDLKHATLKKSGDFVKNLLLG